PARHVADAVADDRHEAAVEVGDQQLSGLAGRDGLEGLGVDDLDELMVGMEMVDAAAALAALVADGAGVHGAVPQAAEVLDAEFRGETLAILRVEVLSRVKDLPDPDARGILANGLEDL